MFQIGFLLPVISVIAVFTFVAVATWSDNRRKERETYYRHETYRQLIEKPGESSKAVLEMMRQEQLQASHRRLEGMKLGGMITAAAGLGSMVFLYALVDGEAVFLAGLIPLLIGLVLLVYSLTSRTPPGVPSATSRGTEG